MIVDRTFEVLTTTIGSKKYFSINLKNIDITKKYYLAIYEFDRESMLNTQYVWSCRPIEELLATLGSEDDFHNNFYVLKLADIRYIGALMDGVRFSDIEHYPDVDVSDIKEFSSSFIDMNEYVQTKDQWGYVGSADKFYQMDLYVFDTYMKDGQVNFKEKVIKRGVLRYIELNEKSQSNIPYFINGEPIHNTKMKTILESRSKMI